MLVKKFEEENYNFQIAHTEAMKKSIVFQVWDSDMGKDDPQGEVCKDIDEEEDGDDDNYEE